MSARKGKRQPKALEPRRTAAWKRGANLAVDLLEECAADDAMAMCGLEPQWRNGKPQRDVVSKYLGKLPDDPEVRAGFTSMLSHELSHLENGSRSYLGYLECLANEPAKAAQRSWAAEQKRARKEWERENPELAKEQREALARVCRREGVTT